MSSPEVTITIGRSGQVVTKRSKRSRGERFGSNGDNFLSSANKRNRGDGSKQSVVINGVKGSQIAQNDLRLKLMRNRLSKKARNVEEQGKMDPHKKLLTATQPSTSSGSPYLLPHGSEPNGSNLSRQFLRKDIADDFGKFYSYQSVGGSRSRSPERIVKSYSRLSPPRNFEEIRKVMPARTADVSRGGRFLSDEIPVTCRMAGSPPVILKPTPQSGNLVPRVAPTSGMTQMISHTGEEPQTVATFLHSLGLGKYVVNFQAEEVDMAVLKQMGDQDLKEMGIPMGPRKKILLALLACLKRQKIMRAM